MSCLKNIPDFEKKFGYGGFIQLEHNAETGLSNMLKNGKLFRAVTKNCFDFEERVREMNECRVNVQAVSTVPVMFHYWAKSEDAEITSRFLNDDLVSSCNKFPSRFVCQWALFQCRTLNWLSKKINNAGHESVVWKHWFA